MTKKEKYHFKPNQVKLDIIDFLLKNADPISEPKILQELKNQYGGINQSNVNRPLHWLHDKECLELEKRRSNMWSIKTIKNLDNILKEFPELVELLQNSDFALKIVLDALEDALVSSTNLRKTKEYKEKYEEIKERLLNIRKDLTKKLKMSSSFLKLCIQDEYSLYRNLMDLLEISENPTAEPYIGDNFTLFIKSPSCIDLVFKSCIAIEIMQRPSGIRKNMEEEIEYVKGMNDTVSEAQLEKLKLYYKNLIAEREFMEKLEKRDPSEQLKYLKEHHKKLLKAPYFIRDVKFVPVHSSELDKLQECFGKRNGEWDYLEDEKTEGPA